MIDEEKTHEEKKFRGRKQKRRGKGEGSIYPDKKNDRWVGSFYTEDGKRRYVHGKTQEEAREKLRAAQYADKQGSLATGSQQTVQLFMEYWLEEVHKPTIRISSYIRYRGILDNHNLPALGIFGCKNSLYSTLSLSTHGWRKKGHRQGQSRLYMRSCIEHWQSRQG